MPADRRHRTQFTRLCPDDQDRLSRRLREKAIARIRNLLNSSDTKPRMRKDRRSFKFEEFGRRVASGRQHGGGRVEIIRNRIEDAAHIRFSQRLVAMIR